MTDPTSAGTRGRRLARLGAVVVVAGTVALWGYAFSPWAPRGAPDDLEDDRAAAAAEAVCAPHRRAVEDLGSAAEVRSPEERADQLEAATRELEAMVTALASLAPATGPDARLWASWLEDWDRYLQRRREHIDRLRAGVDEPFLVDTAPDGAPILLRMEGFAELNRMPSCAPPPDLR